MSFLSPTSYFHPLSLILPSLLTYLSPLPLALPSPLFSPTHFSKFPPSLPFSLTCIKPCPNADLHIHPLHKGCSTTRILAPYTFIPRATNLGDILQFPVPLHAACQILSGTHIYSHIHSRTYVQNAYFDCAWGNQASFLNKKINSSMGCITRLGLDAHGLNA